MLDLKKCIKIQDRCFYTVSKFRYLKQKNRKMKHRKFTSYSSISSSWIVAGKAVFSGKSTGLAPHHSSRACRCNSPYSQSKSFKRFICDVVVYSPVTIFPKGNQGLLKWETFMTLLMCSYYYHNFIWVFICVFICAINGRWTQQMNSDQLFVLQGKTFWLVWLASSCMSHMECNMYIYASLCFSEFLCIRLLSI